MVSVVRTSKQSEGSSSTSGTWLILATTRGIEENASIRITKGSSMKINCPRCSNQEGGFIEQRQDLKGIHTKIICTRCHLTYEAHAMYGSPTSVEYNSVCPSCSVGVCVIISDIRDRWKHRITWKCQDCGREHVTEFKLE